MCGTFHQEGTLGGGNSMLQAEFCLLIFIANEKNCKWSFILQSILTVLHLGSISFLSTMSVSCHAQGCHGV